MLDVLPIFLNMYFRRLLNLKTLGMIFAPVGALKTLIETYEYFPALKLDKLDALATWLKLNWVLALIFGALIWLFQSIPSLEKEVRVNGRDTKIRIKICDIFSLKGAIVVGASSHFDTSLEDNLISSRTIQGKFTEKYFKQGGIVDYNSLDTQLSERLKGVKATQDRGKKKGKKQKYDIGTCAKVLTRKRSSYFLAISEMQHSGNCKGNIDDLRSAISNLWEYVSSNGDMNEDLLLPILGSGQSRLAHTRSELVKDLIRSFLAACSSGKFVDRMTIAIHPADINNHEIDFEDLCDYVESLCKHTVFQ